MVPYYERDGIVIYHGDCRDVLPNVGTADMVLTDPPYGTKVTAWDESAERLSQSVLPLEAVG